MTSILIVEDDVHIAQGLAEYLESFDYQLDFAYNGQQAMSHLDNSNYDLVLLDLNLPIIDGLDVCRALSQGNLAKIPVIITSARSDSNDVLAGFESGAWDYLVKPFSLAELAARIKVNLAKLEIMASAKLKYRGFTLDENSLLLCQEGTKVQLHRVGFSIMKTLMQSAPQIVQTEILLQKIWGDEKPTSDPLRAHVYKLRQQFTERFDNPLIVTVKGVGYRLDA